MKHRVGGGRTGLWRYRAGLSGGVPRWRAGRPVIVLAVLLVATGLAGCANRSGGGAPGNGQGNGNLGAAPTGSARTSSAPPAVPATWQLLPASPLAYPEATVWTGTEMIMDAPEAEKPPKVVGYNPATRTWRTITPAPYPVASNEGGIDAVWTGQEMLTFGVQNGAYNPSTNTWRPLATPIKFAPAVVVWTGSRVLEWGGGCCDSSSNTGAIYDPASDTWAAIPVAPMPAVHAAGGVWDGTELLVAGGSRFGQDSHGVYTDLPMAEAAAYNPNTRTWRRLPPMPAPRGGASATWTGTEMVLVGGFRSVEGNPLRDAVAYNPRTNAWHTMSRPEIGRTNHMAVWTGHQLVVWGGFGNVDSRHRPTAPAHGESYDPVTDTWTALPKSVLRARSPQVMLWTGKYVLIWGGVTVVDSLPVTDGASYGPLPG
jgi:Kelch motif